jgi:hypothetical protein
VKPLAMSQLKSRPDTQWKAASHQCMPRERAQSSECDLHHDDRARHLSLVARLGKMAPLSTGQLRMSFFEERRPTAGRLVLWLQLTEAPSE